MSTDVAIPSIQLSPEQLAGLELFLHGALERFELPGVPLPVLLRDANNVRLATIQADGSLDLIEPPRHADFRELRHSVAELAATTGGAPQIAVTTDSFLSVETEQALAAFPGARVIHVIEPGAADHFARVRAAQIVAARVGAIVNILPAPATEAILRKYGATDILAPAGSTYDPAVAAIRDDAIPPRRKQGFCVWFTGLPSAGKSTIADQLAILLRERGRRVTMLDGDVVRTHLSKGLGFSREDRDTNIRRIGWVASEIVRHHGVAIAAAVSPFAGSRDDARRLVGENFILVHVATPAEVCETRDVKGFYAQARAGAIKGFTGVDDPYEAPTNAELTLPTTDRTPQQNASAVLHYLIQQGLAN